MCAANRKAADFVRHSKSQMIEVARASAMESGMSMFLLFGSVPKGCSGEISVSDMGSCTVLQNYSDPSLREEQFCIKCRLSNYISVITRLLTA